jgi:hypothetical protein
MSPLSRKPLHAEAWSPTPIRRVNATTLASTACWMVFLGAYEPDEVEHIDFIRGSAALLVILHAAFHLGALYALKSLVLDRVDRATEALESYRDPRRLSHLDLAAAWMLYYALSPCFAAAP